jgi:hypothetical protein
VLAAKLEEQQQLLQAQVNAIQVGSPLAPAPTACLHSCTAPMFHTGLPTTAAPTPRPASPQQWQQLQQLQVAQQQELSALAAQQTLQRRAPGVMGHPIYGRSRTADLEVRPKPVRPWQYGAVALLQMHCLRCPASLGFLSQLPSSLHLPFKADSLRRKSSLHFACSCRAWAGHMATSRGCSALLGRCPTAEAVAATGSWRTASAAALLTRSA